VTCDQSHLLARLRGLLAFSRLDGGTRTLPDALAGIAEIVGETCGFRTVAVNLYRAAWDDFEVAAVAGSDGAREALLGTTMQPAQWAPLLDERFCRRGAYLVPHGAVDWADHGPTFMPALEEPADSAAWHPEDALFAPLRGADGTLLGVLSVDEPVSGLLPADADLEVLAELAAYAAQAIETAQQAENSARHRHALERLMRVSSGLAGTHSPDEVLKLVCDAIRDALGFEHVVLELPDPERNRFVPRATASNYAADDPRIVLHMPIDELLSLFRPEFEVEGCYLLSLDQARALVRPEQAPTFRSRRNGRGPNAWQRHWLIVPLVDESGSAFGFIWVDDPEDRLVPSRARLGALRLFADLAATALVSARQFEELRAANELSRGVIDSSPLGIVLLDRAGRVLSWNEAARAMYGFADDAVLGHEPPWIRADRRDGYAQRFGDELAGLAPTRNDWEATRGDGSSLIVSTSSAPLRDGAGEVTGLVAMVADITERTHLEEELRRQNAELLALNETSIALIDRLDVNGVLETIVARAAGLLGSPSGYLYLVDPDGEKLEAAIALGSFAGLIARPLVRGEGLGGRVWAEERTVVVDEYAAWGGRVVDYDARGYHAIAGVPIRSGDRVTGVLGVGLDEPGRTFTEGELALLARFAHLASLALENARLYESAQRELGERRATEEELRRSQELYRSLVESSRDHIVLIDLDGTVRYQSPSWSELGWEPGELVGRNMAELMHPEDLPPVAAVIVEAIKGGRPTPTVGRVLRRDGSWLELEGMPTAVLGPDGRTQTIQVVARDVSERLRAAEERAKLEARLRQATKMEAVGRLAGGIAHDFNNLLTAIGGYGELALARLADDDSVRRPVEDMVRAGERAARLTGQLLAFSRRQVLQPEVLCLNDVVLGVETMLARLLGERVEIVTELDPGLGSARADRGQLEQVLVNLAINARDAMPAGGRVRIETANAVVDEEFCERHVGAQPGECVVLRVVDEGEGMDAATLAQVFEPFFTTKEPGRGTGLGLSTVYGIVKQTGGWVWAASEPGAGSTFSVYLPRIWELAAPRPVEPAPAKLEGSETVLLVEDEAVVRMLVCEMLERAGFTVLEAPDAARARDLAAGHEGTIDLLLTDVVMPGMSGPELAAELVDERPDLRVLFTSGYTEGALDGEGALREGQAFLAKPFTAAALAQKLRGLLDAA
jgi:PAS domain S-box-containing protein